MQSYFHIKGMRTALTQISSWRLFITACLLLTGMAAQADAWLEGDEQAIWERAPGVYKEGNNWYAILHTKPGDTQVKLYGDFTNGQAGAVAMTRTPDGKFWWFKGTDSSFARAPAHGDHYRFMLTRDGEQRTFQDPAARWVTNSNLSTGMSRIYLSDAYQWASANWSRPEQSALNIYQLHPLRFTDRNGKSPLDEVTEELDGDGTNDYLSETGATAIQLLPVNEFAGALSWGYNPSFFYAVESSYGGPDALKALVDKAHQQGMAVILDLEFNHLGIGDNILYTVNNTTYADGDTVWGPLYNFNNDVAKHFLIQNVLYLAREFNIDGFRFDHTNTIHNDFSGYITQSGDGGGWDFLRELYGTVKSEDPNIWFTAEELPDWWGITADDAGSTVAGTAHAPMDSQWTDTFHDNFKAVLTGGHLDNLWPVFGHFGDGWQDATVYTESHDEVGNTDDRIARRGRDGKGWEMNQLSLTGTIMARGTPMVFMGQEGGETTQFHIDWWDDRLPLSAYETDAGRAKILAWYRKMNDIRAGDPQTLASADSVVTHIHNDNRVAAFSRDGGKYVVVMNFGPTTWYNYDVGVSGTYLEVANTSWSRFNLGGVPEASRGEGVATAISNVHIPAYGAVVLARASTSAAVNFTCNNGTTVWGQNVYVVGNIAELGNWDTTKAAPLNATAYPTWTGTVNDLPANTTVEWKCIKRDSGAVVWQGGANNSVTTPASGSVNSSGSF